MRDGEIAGYVSAVRNVARDNCSQRHPRVPPDTEPVRNRRIWPNPSAILDDGRVGEKATGGDLASLASTDVVGNLHQIVDHGVGANFRVAAVHSPIATRVILDDGAAADDDAPMVGEGYLATVDGPGFKASRRRSPTLS